MTKLPDGDVFLITYINSSPQGNYYTQAVHSQSLTGVNLEAHIEQRTLNLVFQSMPVTLLVTPLKDVEAEVTMEGVELTSYTPDNANRAQYVWDGSTLHEHNPNMVLLA